MAAASRLGYFCLAYLSQPKAQRFLYRQIRRRRPLRIVELGIGTAVRAERMIRVAQRYSQGGPVHYTGVDPFESSSGGRACLTLKAAHRRLALTGARVRLVPGDPLSALAMAANSLIQTDLLVISADQADPSLEAAWFFVPRMLHDGSLVVRERPDARGGIVLSPVPRLEIEQLARASRPGRRAA